MNPQDSHRRDVFHVVQIALGVATSVFLVALYVQPGRVSRSEPVREIRTQQMVYVVDVKYRPTDIKLPF